MDRVIPKDILDLIYKESHLDNTKRLIEEYHKLFHLNTVYYDILVYENKEYPVRRCLNNRELRFGCKSITNFKEGRLTWYYVPERYFYSSGNNELKWIE